MAHSGKIPNTLVDVLLLIGLDDDTNLQPISKRNIAGTQPMCTMDYEPQVLVAASATDMVKFFPFPDRIAGYPPNSETRSKTQQRDGVMASTSPRITNRLSVNPKLLKRHTSIRRAGNKSGGQALLPELPISEEVIRSIPSLCFPDGMEIYKVKPENSIHFLVLTDMTGSKSYACCLTFSRTFLVEEDDQGYQYLSLEVDRNVEEANDKSKTFVHIPHCCITISQFPYYVKMKECLSSMIAHVEKDQEELYTFLKEYSHILTNTPVPPPGNVAVELNLNQLPVVLQPTDHPDKPVMDFPLHLIFLCFKTEEFLKIIAYVLQEERLVFLSSNYSLLTIVMESVRHLILPFEWRFTYVTVLPSNGLGYLQAPGTFMFGCHSRHKERVKEIDDLVLVDIDLGEVTMNSISAHTEDEGISVPCLPKDATKTFMEVSPRFRLVFDTELLQRPSFYNLDDLKQFRAKKESEIMEIITQACLELLVNLFRSVVSNLRVEQRYFNKEQFLNQFMGRDRKFYEKVLTTNMFKKFLEDRMDEKKDCWSDFEMKTRDYLRRASLQTSNRFGDILNQRLTMSRSFHSKLLVFKLPDVTNTSHYVADCCKTLSIKIKDCPDYYERLSYIYLRAMFHMAANDKMAAMDDFITLSSSITKIVPIKNLCETYNRLSDPEKEMFCKKKGHEVLLEIIEAVESADEHSEHRSKKIRMDPISLPERDIKLEEFADCVSLLNMSNDFTTTERLFKALTINNKNAYVVDHFTFAACVEHWMNNRHQCSHIKFDEDKLQEEEIILKMSDFIKTDYGLGRIGLTDKRLFFLLNVTNKYTEIAKLQDIEKLEKSQYYSLFQSTIDILLIHKKDKSLFTAYLKEERNWWYVLISEMWAGKQVELGTKDIIAVQQAAQNTLLIDAVIGSSQDDITAHSNKASEAASKLCYFTEYVRDGKHILSKATFKALQKKIDPNIGEQNRKTVQALLYSEGDETLSPKLWCGLSDGKVKVYNAATLTVEGGPLQTKQSVACLTAVSKGQVWAGSYDIHIINTETITFTQTLKEHQDLVVEIVPYDENKYVYSASLDGTIIKWDVKKLKKIQPDINLQGQIKCIRSLKIHQDKLFCGSWLSVLMCDLKGTVLSQFQAKDSNRVIELDSFIILPSGEMWTGCRRESWVYVWDINSGELVQKIDLPRDSKGVSMMSQADDKVWVGSKEGSINIFSTVSKQLCSTVKAHEDAVRVLCTVKDRYMVSGGGSIDGKVCVWSLSASALDSGSFPGASG